MKISYASCIANHADVIFLVAIFLIWNLAFLSLLGLLTSIIVA
jgi:hypothetical protein